MGVMLQDVITRPVHSWLHRINVAFVEGPMTPLLGRVAQGLLDRFRERGHQVQDAPDDETDVILTTSRFGEPLSWRRALLFSARRRFKLSRAPTLFTLVHVMPDTFQRVLGRFRAALAKRLPDPADYDFPGLASRAYRVLFEQGHRGGPILALERLVQAQAKSIRSILLVGEQDPLEAYFFDLAGAHPRTPADDLARFYDDLALRIATAVCTHEVTEHQIVRELISAAEWRRLETPAAMRLAGQEFGRRGFFTEMVRIGDLVNVPAVGDAVAGQYSEGCFATWEPALNALLATITGSARPVDKGNITDDDLAVIAGVRPDGRGALVRHVEGKENISPSSESVEMMIMDGALPRVRLDASWGIAGEAPIVRSKLHGHRGIAAYDPRWVEFARLDEPYYHYPVSCATEAQARAIRDAFARTETLRDPDDPRLVAFTVLPGHGVVIAEKWARGKAPFQVTWEYMDAGHIQVDNLIPQGPMEYAPAPDGRLVVRAEEF